MKISVASSFILVATVLLSCSLEFAAGQLGTWQVLQENAGISSMHSAVTRFNEVIMLDRTNIGPSRINLPNGRCRDQPLERQLKPDCWAHSVMFNPRDGAVRALFVFTDTWCSSGQFLGNGVLMQTGGDFEGNKKIRTLSPCRPGGTCDWVETTTELSVGRWYSTNQILPGGNRQIVMGGRGQPNYEFVPKRKTGEGVFGLAVLNVCCDNLYPFVFLLPNGDLFVFADRNSVVLNYNTGKVVMKLPTIPGNPRNYPSGGSAALLPLKAPYTTVEVLVCGGAATGAANKNTTAPASASCGRITPTAGIPTWTMEDMPIRRIMGDMINLPTGEIIIINGAQNGYQGWGKAGNPALNPVSYNGDAEAGARFQILAKTDIPRMYHCTANLFSDGRVIVAGSNTHQFYTYTGTFPTELRVEAFSPPYLGANFNGVRPAITVIPGAVGYNQALQVAFRVGTRVGKVECNLVSAPYSTHSYAQGQRLLKLEVTSIVQAVPNGNMMAPAPAPANGNMTALAPAPANGNMTAPAPAPAPANLNMTAPAPAPANGNMMATTDWNMTATAPPSANVAPQQYYMLFIVQDGIPSLARWIRLIT